MAENAILYDSSKCSACKGCQVMCKQWNMLPASLGKDVHPFSGSYQAPMDLSGDTRLIITFNESAGGPNGVEWAFTRRSCFHCTDPACMEICPSGAISKLENGTVRLDSAKCIGCKYCAMACPFEVPKYRENHNYTNKCTLCYDRVEQGREPACVHTCPAGALTFGPREETLATAKERVDYLKAKGFDRAELYGESEMGGLHVLTVAKYGLESHGLPRNPQMPDTLKLAQLMKPLTGLGVAAVVAGLGLSFVTAMGYQRDGDSVETGSTSGKEL